MKMQYGKGEGGPNQGSSTTIEIGPNILQKSSKLSMFPQEDDRLRQLGGRGVRSAWICRVGDGQAEQDHGADGGRRQHGLLLDGTHRTAACRW